MRAILLYFSLLLSACAVELVMRVSDKPWYNPDTNKAARGQSVAGMIIDIGPDGRDWGTDVRQPQYIIIKLPGVTNTALLGKYIAEDTDGTNIVRCRRWKYQLTNMPAVSRRIFTNDSITIRASGGHLTWGLFRTNLLDLRTGLVETNDLQ